MHCNVNITLTASDVIKLRREPTNTTFLNKCNSQLHSKYLSLYPQKLSAHIKGALFFFSKRLPQKSTTDQNAEKSDLAVPLPFITFVIQSLCTRLNHLYCVDEGVEILQKPVDQKVSYKILSYIYDREFHYEISTI